MIAFLWRIVAWFVTRPAVSAWLIRRAQRTPYSHITSKDGSSLYMGRWWLFNPYTNRDPRTVRGRLLDRLPSVRIHHIMRPDMDRDLHDHPWNARTIILAGGYKEERLVEQVPHGVDWHPVWPDDNRIRAGFTRRPGYTGRLMHGEYHRISWVPPEGAWTMFWTWRKRGSWGFRVDGVKVPWREYLGIPA